MAYSVPDLPYDYNALEPHIDEQTMHLHHDKHHQAYVDKVNAALEGTEWEDKPIEDVLKNLDKLGDKATAVRNNGGGHYNHSLFWEWMSRTAAASRAASSPTRSTRPSAPSTRSRTRSRTAGVNQFGSGWSWLVHDGIGPGGGVVGEPGQPDLRTAARRCSASTSGSTPTT